MKFCLILLVPVIIATDPGEVAKLVGVATDPLALISDNFDEENPYFVSIRELKSALSENNKHLTGYLNREPLCIIQNMCVVDEYSSNFATSYVHSRFHFRANGINEIASHLVRYNSTCNRSSSETTSFRKLHS